MKKLDQLFIRACKSYDPYKRIRSVYKRFYAIDVPEDHHIAGVLSEVFERNCLIKISDIYWDFHPDNQFSILNDGDQPYAEKFIRYFISKIRYKNTSNFPGLTSPARYKKGEIK